MRAVYEIHREIERIQELFNLQTDRILGGAEVKIEVIDKSELPKHLTAGRVYEDEPLKREGYISGLMDGRLQALRWVLGETEDLYEDW